jgi:ATP-dependent protease ClpP protease subunit
MCPNPVTVLATKWARSMTSIIPLAADRFFIRPPSKYMFHRGQYGFTGLDQEAETADIERRKAHEMMFRIYVARLMSQGCFSTWSSEAIRKMLDDKSKNDIDVWFTADEAVHWGFADGVFEGDFSKLRVTKRNLKRRAQMLEVLRRPLNVTVSVS